ncbi:NAD(P)/FAD-dependent oxidoreductase [Paenibacillus sp. JCM 10914]|uniref:flavin-containing monooxygenase n=1 Tax=Paenibacillus sp. JCM 10914 TaxID=1236974 RepID=UPI0005603338|nr:NAD(P)-binding domain-containing protein [Paenibacillus sp. JCM 10914]
MWDVVVIGAGQAGLAAGYWLRRAGMSFVMLDRGSEPGETWLARYESLRLFTPRTHSALPGMEMQGNPDGFPDKYEVAAYLKSYASRFELPIQWKQEVLSVTKERDGFVIHTEGEELRAKKLIIATGPFQRPRIPAFSAALPKDILQLHSSAYMEPSQLQGGNVLVVGGGNSGAQIATELSGSRETYLSLGQRPRILPMTMGGKSMFWWLDRLGILSARTDSWIGRALRRKGDPIFGYELKQAVKCGKVVLKKRAVRAGSSGMELDDGTIVSVRNVIWATGFVSRYDWLRIEGAMDHEQAVIHANGHSPISGLYYVGLPWQTHRGSALLTGVGRDARAIVQAIINEEGD